MGKTVTLLEVRRRAEGRGFVVARVTADPNGGLPGRLAESVAGALAAAAVHRRGAGWARLAERLSAFNIQVSVAGVVSLGATGTPAEDATASRDMLRSLVVDAAAQLIEAGRAGLVLTLDELQAAPSRICGRWSTRRRSGRSPGPPSSPWVRVFRRFRSG